MVYDLGFAVLVIIFRVYGLDLLQNWRDPHWLRLFGLLLEPYWWSPCGLTWDSS